MLKKVENQFFKQNTVTKNTGDHGNYILTL